MSTNLLVLVTFAAGALLVIGLFSVVSDLVLKDRNPLARRLDMEFRAKQRDEIRKSPLFRNLDRATAADDGDGGPTRRQRLTGMIEQSGVKVTLERLAGITVVVGVGVGILTGLLRQSVVIGLLVGLLAAAVPVMYVARKRAARRAKLMRQLPDVFDLMARIIRAGQTTTQAIEAVADEFDQPVAGEFAYCADQQNLGLAPEIALRDLARRTDLLEIKVFVLALIVQQQTGGNLAELLDKLAAVVRDRFRMQSRIRALTAEGRLQAVVLLILPFAIMGILMLVSSTYAASLIQHPGVVVVMIAIETVGALWIRRIVRFDF